MNENLEIIKAIMTEAIKIDITGKQDIEFNYHSASKKLTISVCTDATNPTFNDGLTRSWHVSVKNTELLKAVLKELQNIEVPAEESSKEVNDFLG
ncbi:MULTISPECIES: hypothetical protein [Clostridium]|uniref:hypothetical protein n=1 Tax=Clostridium TaxID=1485 RepID=UPI00069E4C7B|nr:MULTISPECIES: hypothetical protein [Clostridium]KOF56642.1 hypothetical protein AGR56_07890 [Clostridium sp. DMHC 10]MCD2348113.1 hypothetical protein [Clostridium guangxiense]